MRDYFKNREDFIKRIWFFKDECHCSGSGVMTWNPGLGFHIAARVKWDKPLPPRKDIQVISIDHDVRIRMELDNGVRCIVPNARISDMAIISGHLSLDVKCVIFVQTVKKEAITSSWFGSALYDTRAGLLLPDVVSRETRIGSRQTLLGESLSGLHYEDDSGQTIVGQLTDKRYLDVNWSLPRALWSKTDNWRFAVGLRDAISIAAGEIVQLLYHRSYRHRRIYTEMREEEQPYSLGILFRPFEQAVLDKDMIVRLASFLMRGGKESDICRKIFYQMADASRQKTWQARELLLSTILEASLRTLYEHPFTPDGNRRSDSFRLGRELKKFREQYLSDPVDLGRKWKKAIRRVVEIHRRLRHRNAHPDWLSGQGGASSSEEMEKTLNDVIFLSRFYGYMILALAGFEKVEPEFPKPFVDWKPMLTVQRLEKEDTEDQ